MSILEHGIYILDHFNGLIRESNPSVTWGISPNSRANILKVDEKNSIYFSQMIHITILIMLTSESLLNRGLKVKLLRESTSSSLVLKRNISL